MIRVTWSSSQGRRFRKSIISIFLLVSLSLVSVSASAIYDPGEDRWVYWDGCEEDGANCTEGDSGQELQDRNANCFYKSPLGLARSVVDVQIDFPPDDTGGCTGLLVGERFIVLAAHCFLNKIGDGNGWPTPATTDQITVWYHAMPHNTSGAYSGGAAYTQHGIAFFVNDDMYIGTRGKKSSEDQVLDVAQNDYECSDGHDDIAIIVLAHPADPANASIIFDADHRCDESTPCVSPDEVCTPYGFCSAFRSEVQPLFEPPTPPYEETSAVVWLNQSFWPDAQPEPCGGLLQPPCDQDTVVYGAGNSNYDGFDPTDSGVLRWYFAPIEDVADEMLILDPSDSVGGSFGEKFRTVFEKGDSGGPCFRMEMVEDSDLCDDGYSYLSDDPFKYVGFVSGAGLENEGCLEAANWVYATCWGLCGVPGCIQDCIAAYLTQVKETCDVVSCFTSIHSEMNWILAAFRNIDNDGDGFIPRDSLATEPISATLRLIDDGSTFPDPTNASENWLEPLWPTEPSPIPGWPDKPLNCLLAPPVDWEETEVVGGVSTIRMWDNCPDIYNPKQEDYDCDGVGDACDNCVYYFNPDQLNSDVEVDGIGDTYGDACDACPRMINEAEDDLNSDGEIDYRDQWDLDGDRTLRYSSIVFPSGDTSLAYGDPMYGGDICDEDPDGDNSLLIYPEPEDYPTSSGGGAMGPSETVDLQPPEGDCSPLLWTLSVDQEEDSACDLYNFSIKEATIANGSGSLICDPLAISGMDEGCIWWVPLWDNGVLNQRPYPGNSYLKPVIWYGYMTETHPDINNQHYISEKYKNAYGGSPLVYGYVDNLKGWVEQQENPGEMGYNWLMPDVQISDSNFYFDPILKTLELGYQACLMNLADVWRYYGGTVERYDLGGSGTGPYAYSFVIEPPMPDEFWQRDQLVEQFNLLLEGPDVCKIDNCIRFNRMSASTNQIDPLSENILVEDSYNDIDYVEPICPLDETYDSFGCWTLNHEAGELSLTNVNCCKMEYIFPDGWKWVDVDEPEEAPGYLDFYINPGKPMDHRFENGYFADSGQLDSNHDGIGDQCSAWVEIKNLEQSHSVLTDVAGTWEDSDWDEFYETGIEWVGGIPYDIATGLPVRRAIAPYDQTPSEEELENPCILGLPLVGSCTIQKKVVRASQKTEFDVSGFNLGETGIPTTIGACTCSDAESDLCYDVDQSCWRPLENGWETDSAAYEQAVIDTEYRGNRPRYAGFRRFGNRDSEWQERLITPVCSKSKWFGGLPYFVQTEFNDTTTTVWTQGWDENSVQVADGCQEINVDFEDGQHRELRWRYIGQVEPDPSDTGFDWTTKPNGEQLWMEGNTTAMRVGLEKSTGALPGQVYWRRQWHTETYEPDGFGNDNDRPISETEFGLGNDDGVVVFEPTYGPGPGLGDLITPIYEWEKILWIADPEYSNRQTNESRFVDSVMQDGNSVWISTLAVNRGSGAISRTPGAIAVQSIGFPVKEFGYVVLALSNSVAQRLFGYNGNEQTVSVDVVVGGRDSNGSILSQVLVKTSWSENRAFVPMSLSVPLGIASPKLFVDSETGQLYVIGGQTAGGHLDRVRALDFANRKWVDTWRSAENGLPLDPTMSSASYALDIEGNRAYLVLTDQSGIRVSRFTPTTSGPSIEPARLVANNWSAREGTSVVYSSRYAGIILYGGYDIAAQTYRSDIWLVEPERSVLRSLGGEATTTIPGRKNAQIVVGDTGQMFVIGGESQYGRASNDFTVAFDPRRMKIGWAISGTAEERTLSGDGTPQRGVFRPGEPSFYRLVADLGGAQRASVQVALNSSDGELELLAVSPTGELRRGRSGLLMIDAHRGEEWQIAVRALDGNASAATGAEYVISAQNAKQDLMVGQVSTWPMARFDVEGDVVYIANWNKLLVYRRAGSVLAKIGQLSMSGAADVEVVGHVAYIADFFDGLVAVNVSNPAAPVVMDKEWVLGMPDSVAVRGDRVYLGAGLFGVQVVDSTDPANLAWSDSISVDDVVVDVSVSGDHLLIGDLLNGVEVFALNRDGTASRVGSYTSWGWVEDSAVRGNTLYVKDFGGGLEIVDLRIPSSPRRVSVATTGGGREVSARLGDDVIALPGAISGVKVYDIKQQ